MHRITQRKSPLLASTPKRSLLAVPTPTLLLPPGNSYLSHTRARLLITYNSTDEGSLQVAVLDAFLGLADAWRASTKGANDRLFSGSAEGISALSNLLADGKMSDGPVDNDNIETTNELKRAMAAVVIPQIWALSPDQLYPVVIRVSRDTRGLPTTHYITLLCQPFLAS